jgi:hypothetical protein
MKKLAALLIAAGGLLSACVAYVPVSDRTAHEQRDRRGPHDGDRDGVSDRADGDRDGDGVPNRRDRQPDNPRRY